jgi:polysaccharide biosynthesis protein VpsM
VDIKMKNGVLKFLLRYTPLSILVLVFLPVCWVCSAHAETEGFEWERFRLRPSIALNQVYTDNVFRTNRNERSEYITLILPKIALDLALAPDNAITLFYEGDFRYYRDYDNFRNDHHLSGISWKALTEKGSQFDIGTIYQDDAFQPYSPIDRSSDFTKWDVFGHALIQVGAASEIGLRYDRASRRMDDSRDKSDNFDRDAIAVTFYYKSFPASSLLMEYAYIRQENEDLSGPSTDMKTHTLFGGIRWDATAKLSGLFKAGYSQTDFKEVPDFSGFVMDADLTYRFSEITNFVIGARRAVSRSTRAERETGDYVISTEGRFAILYNKWEKLFLKLELSYTNNDFEARDASARQREDNFFRTAFSSEYRFMEPLSFYFHYDYKRNDSDENTVDYMENRFEAGIKFAL